jgi:hypothetical protein
LKAVESFWSFSLGGGPTFVPEHVSNPLADLAEVLVPSIFWRRGCRYRRRVSTAQPINADAASLLRKKDIEASGSARAPVHPPSPMEHGYSHLVAKSVGPLTESGRHVMKKTMSEGEPMT